VKSPSKQRSPALIAFGYGNYSREVLARRCRVKDSLPLCEGYTYESEAGPFHIVEHDELFHPVFQGYYLGAYPTAQKAADDLAQGRTKVPGVDNAASLRIPPDLRQWQSPN